MNFIWTTPFKKDFKKLPQKTKKKFEKQINFLISDMFYPSLHTKKMQGREDIWEARIDKFYRFTFQMEGENIILRRIGPHDKGLGKK